MILKQCQFRGSGDGSIHCLPLYSHPNFEKISEARDFRSKLHPQVQDFIKAVRPTKSGIYILVNAMGAGEYWGSNVNGDLFPEKALIHSPPDWARLSVYAAREKAKNWDYGYPTFMNAYPYKHHVNKDPSRAFGRVELAVWNAEMHRVELVVYLDRALCKKFDAYDIIERIENGEFPDVSMGCKVPYDVCTICEHKSKTRDDYCEHARTMMNKILHDGRKVAVRNDTPRFFDISFVFIGADKTAKVMAKLARKGNQVCMGEFCALPRSSAEVGEMFSKEANGDMQQYYQDHPSKLKAKLERDRKKGMKKEASLFDSMKDFFFGDEKAKGRQQKTRTDQENKTMLSDSIPERNYDAHLELMKMASPLRKALHIAKQHGERAALAGGISAAGSYGGNRAVGSDPETTKRRTIRDGVSGAIIGGLMPLAKHANDPIKEKVLHRDVPIHIEWKKGEIRQYKKNGIVKYKRFMKANYGYIPGTKDADGEEIDVYLGPDKNAKKAYVIKQLKKDGSFDENKVMIGYSSEKAAHNSYDYHMGGAKEHFGDIHEVEVSALQALFGDNGDGKEKTKHAAACECDGSCSPCGGSTAKEAAVVFGVTPEKYASHRKLSEILKDIPAGPFTRETLPRLEKSERDLPDSLLDMMGHAPLGASMSTAGMLGIILKPREFQRVILIHIGERGLADQLDRKGMTFRHTDEIDDSIPVDEKHVDSGLKKALTDTDSHKNRSIAAISLNRRAAHAAGKRAPVEAADKTSEEPILDKVAAAYNGYRRSLIKKADQIEFYLASDPQLRSDLFGDSMAKAFAGGIDKASSASVLSPDSLAYLVGAYTERDFHVTSGEVVASLAHTGAASEAA